MIQFQGLRRGAVPAEGEEGNAMEARLQPRLMAGPTVDAVEFKNNRHWGGMLQGADLAHALNEAQRIMLHEMEDGKAVRLPGIGTFRLSLKGEVEILQGNYHGNNVHVEGILFQPDPELLEEVRRLEVSQVPAFVAAGIEDEVVEERFTELFAANESVTNRNVLFAFQLFMSRHRVYRLLKRLTEEGRLIREGQGAQTRYRPAPGHFGR